MADSVLSRPMFSLYDPRTVAREGEFMTQAQLDALRGNYNRFSMMDPSSVLREGEMPTQDQIFSLLSLLDPTRNTVREGEYMTSSNAQDVPDSIKKEYNKLINSDPSSVLREGEMPTEDQVDQYTSLVNDPEFQSFLMDSYGDKGQGILSLLLQGNTPDNFSYLTGLMNEFTNYKIAKEMKEKGAVKPKPFEIPEEELNYLNRLKYKAEGGEMKSDAVGIADGLDAEEETMTVERGPSDSGIAKVSPEQYVLLMNEVRGDDVPLEGRVQELAMKVGEKDAQATPLSVLALVQPVFELEEQGGVAQTQQAQQMMQQAPMQMNKGGIVYAADGIFADMESMLSPGASAFLKNLQEEYYGGSAPFDLEAAKKSYADILTQKNKDYYTPAMAPLFAFAQTALDPEKTAQDVTLSGFGSLAQYGQDIKKQQKEIDTQALALALEDKKQREKQKADYGNFIATSMKDIIFMDPTERQLKMYELDDAFIKNQMNKIDLFNYKDLKGTELAKTKEDLEAVKLSNQNAVIGLKYEDQSQYNNIIKQKLDIETAQNTLQAKENEQAVIDNVKVTLLTDPNLVLSPQDESMIKLDPLKWLESNKSKVGEVDKLAVQIEKDLRDDFQKGSDTFVKATDNINVIRGAIETEPSNAGDIALIYSYMKMLDPTSTVMQGEYATVQNAGTVPQSVLSYYNKLVTTKDGFLDKDIRKDFVARAETLYNQRVNQHDKFKDTFMGIIDRYKDYGVKPEGIFQDFSSTSILPKEYGTYSGGVTKWD